MGNKQILPIFCNTSFEEKCVACSACEPEIFAASLRAVGCSGETMVSIGCKNKQVCDALEERRWESFMPCEPGEELYFLNGQKGRVTEIAFNGNEQPLVRCMKFIGNDSYDSSFRADALGRTVFLDLESCQNAMREEEQDEKHAD